MAQITEDVKTVVLPRLEQRDYLADSFIDDIGSLFDKIRGAWLSFRFGARAKAMAEAFVTATTRKAAKKFGIDAYKTPRMQEFMRASVAQNVALIKSVAEEHLNAVQNIVMNNVTSGFSPDKIIDEIAAYGVTKGRAALIAYDQTTKILGQTSRINQQEAGFRYFRWQTSNDERVRHSHTVAQNTVTAYGKGVYSWDDLPTVDGEKAFPGSPIRCFPGSVNVNLFYGAQKAWRYRYSGETIELITAKGTRLVCTPNHPILTDRGFVAANALNTGDYVVHVPKQSINGLNADADCFNAKFAELFHALSLVGIRDKTKTAVGTEFDGDIRTNEEIDVINIDWILPDSRNSIIEQRALQFFLAVAHEIFDLPFTARSCHFFLALQGLTLAPKGVMCSASQFLAFLSSCFAHSDEHCLAAVRLLYSSLIKYPSNDVATCLEVFGDLFNADLPIKHRLNFLNRKILSIGRYSFGAGNLKTPSAEFFTHGIGMNTDRFTSGGECLPLVHQFERLQVKRAGMFSHFVYDLTMENGLFVADYTAVSNCRCVAIPVPDYEVEDFQKQKEKK